MSDKLSLTIQTLNSAKDLKEMFELPAVRHNAVTNRMKTLGASEAQAVMHYEREKILFFKALQANKKLESCDRFSIYSSWIELHASGQTLNEGHAYIIPYGAQAQFQIGWKGRLDMMGQIPEIENVPPPQVVHDNDEFDYELGDKPRIIRHKPAKIGSGNLTHVYLVIQKTSGNETHIMTRAEVLAIRDRYSKTYLDYARACEEAKVELGKPVTRTGQYGPYTIEPPSMWFDAGGSEGWKKTIVKRAWKSQSNKSARMKAIDAKIANNTDPEDGSGGQETHDIDYGLQEQPALSEASKTPPTSDLGNLSEAF